MKTVSPELSTALKAITNDMIRKKAAEKALINAAIDYLDAHKAKPKPSKGLRRL